MNLFVTGVGTGVGKTEFSTSLIRQAKTSGEGCRGIKAVESGVVPGQSEPTDAARLAEAGSHEELCYASLALAASPWIAAKSENAPIDFDALVAWILSQATAPGLNLVEGAGGWMVPITESHTMADLARSLGWPVLVVGWDALGGVNHALLTLSAIGQTGLPSAFVLNRSDEYNSNLTNEAQIRRYSSSPIWNFSMAASKDFAYRECLEWVSKSQVSI